MDKAVHFSVCYDVQSLVTIVLSTWTFGFHSINHSNHRISPIYFKHQLQLNNFLYILVLAAKPEVGDGTLSGACKPTGGYFPRRTVPESGFQRPIAWHWSSETSEELQTNRKNLASFTAKTAIGHGVIDMLCGAKGSYADYRDTAY